MTSGDGLDEPLHPAADVRLGDLVRLRRPHPCGADTWRVVRIGAEIGLRCTGCDHKVLLLRRVFRQRFKSRLERTEDRSADAPDAGPDDGAA